MNVAKLDFEEKLSNVFKDSRSYIHLEDAKIFFLTRYRKYDIIVSEPCNHLVSSVATLFSDEFYHKLICHMNESGILVH